MKILVTGANGQLGYDVVKEISRRGHEAIATGTKIINNKSYKQMDIINPHTVNEVITEVKPDAVIHCAAYTSVDLSYDEKEIAYMINVVGTQNLVNACEKINAKMMYISSDYVFSGEGNKPWKPDCNNYHPLNIYGKTKLLGEEATSVMLTKYFIVRISWVFGINGKNFVKTMLNHGKTNKELNVVNDQIGTPTYTVDLARLLIDMIETDKYGYYHATNEGGYVSWYDFAKEIFKQAIELGHAEYINTKVNAITSKELARAPRPLNSRLDKSKLIENGFKLLPTWQDALNRYLHEIEF